MSIKVQFICDRCAKVYEKNVPMLHQGSPIFEMVKNEEINRFEQGDLCKDCNVIYNNLNAEFMRDAMDKFNLDFWG